MPPEQIAERKAVLLANAKSTCATRGVNPTDIRYVQCINGLVGKHGFEAQGLTAIQSQDGSITLVEQWKPGNELNPDPLLLGTHPKSGTLNILAQ